MKNQIFNRIKREHPDWSDEKIWIAVSLEMQSANVVEKSGKDVELNNDLMEQILRGAEEWLEVVLPHIFNKVRDLFERLLANIGEWIKKGIEYVITFIGNYF